MADIKTTKRPTPIAPITSRRAGRPASPPARSAPVPASSTSARRGAPPALSMKSIRRAR